MNTPAANRFWQRTHHLGRMGLRDLVRAYFTHHAVIAYLALAMLCAIGFVRDPAPPGPTLAIVLLVALAYPLVWYVLHRWVLHTHWMFKVPMLAALWKRIHYDHHMDPDRLEVLFGALYTTLPTLLVVAALPGWLIGGTGGALAGFATGLLCTCFYEFAHCVQHLGWKPRQPWLAAMKRRHMEHHFHDERGNFGITNFAWDRLFGTFYTRAERPAKSATVFNLGYDEAAARAFPQVAARSRAPRRCRAATEQRQSPPGSAHSRRPSRENFFPAARGRSHDAGSPSADREPSGSYSPRSSPSDIPPSQNR